MNVQIKFILWPIYSREKDAVGKFCNSLYAVVFTWTTHCQSTFLFSSFLASFPDESFDKTFHVSVSIDGITADHKPVTVLHSDRAHNRYTSCLLACAVERFLFCNSHFLQRTFHFIFLCSSDPKKGLQPTGYRTCQFHNFSNINHFV